MCTRLLALVWGAAHCLCHMLAFLLYLTTIDCDNVMYSKYKCKSDLIVLLMINIHAAVNSFPFFVTTLEIDRFID